MTKIMNERDVGRSGLTEWRDIPPMTYVDIGDRQRKKRDGPEWGLGPYRGEYVRNKHINRGMYALRPSRKQPTTYMWGGMKEHIYSDAVDRLVRIIDARIKADQQVIIHIGDANGNGTGSGKSTLGLALACDIQRQMDRSFVLARDLVLDAANFMGRVRYGEPDGILLLDEAHEILGTNKASEKGAKFLRQCFASLRSRHNVIILVSPRLSGLTTIMESELVDIRIDCSNAQSSWIPSIGRGLFQTFLAVRQQRFGRTRKNEPPFWKLIFTGLFYPKMLPHGLWEEYSVFKTRFQDMMLDKSIKKAEADDEEALAYIKTVFGLDDLRPDEIAHMVSQVNDTTQPPTPQKPKKPSAPATDEDGNPIVRKRGRPKGSKDSYKRVVTKPRKKQSDQQAQRAHMKNPEIIGDASE